MNNIMADREIETLAYIRVKSHHILILYCLSLYNLVVKPHFFNSTHALGLPSIQRLVLYNGMCLQFGMGG
jgi:hypothetical protein